VILHIEVQSMTDCATRAIAAPMVTNGSSRKVSYEDKSLIAIVPPKWKWNIFRPGEMSFRFIGYIA